MTVADAEVKRLPLHSTYAQAGARFIQFALWEVPVYFTGILDEHQAVRTRAGFFDISHMGEFRVTGSGSRAWLDHLITNAMEKLMPGKAMYSPMLNERGGIIDDLIVYELAAENYLVIVNAGNIQKDFAWMSSQAPSSVQVENRSAGRGIFAVQGPVSPAVLSSIFGQAAASIPPFHFLELPFESGKIILARTGYTGEDGFEIFFDQNLSLSLYQALKKAGEPLGMKPIGFGARDTLRLEARLLLHGHDMNESVTPLECGLSWTVDLTKKDFVGLPALLRQQSEGISRALVGFEMISRTPAREHYKVCVDGREVGEVTSGTFSPTLKKNIGLALIENNAAILGNELEIIVRDVPQKAKIVKTPFYKRSCHSRESGNPG
ncbi:MAG: glycine cleavage system aminomethyltransferase GcvT [Candidatus Omnitrophica bacterium]|nr:glycine cleavage system aminomethyltransferase GcvT [Candidatus Omnitrophota bacterium]